MDSSPASPHPSSTANTYLHELPPVPPSPPQSFASTAFPYGAPSLNTPGAPPLSRSFLSRGDVAASIKAYETLLEAAKAYRKSLATVATAASSFGAALEACARCKGAGDTADGLMNAGGLQYLIASNTHILAESLYRGFEVPLLHELDNYKEKTAENEERYKKDASEKNRELRRGEQEHLNLAKKKRRNLSAFRSALVDLTRQIDELDNLKYSHYQNALTLSQENSTRILDCSALVVRAEVEIFEKIAQKGWDSSGGLDDLISRSADPFSPEPKGNGEGGEIFSILPSQSILPSPHGTGMSRSGSLTASGGGGDGRNGSGTLDGAEGKYQSITGALSHHEDYEEYEDEDARSIFSGGFSNSSLLGVGRGNGIRLAPFSPAASSAGWGVTVGPRTESSGNTDVTPLCLPPSLDEEARPTSPGEEEEEEIHTAEQQHDEEQEMFGDDGEHGSVVSEASVVSVVRDVRN